MTIPSVANRTAECLIAQCSSDMSVAARHARIRSGRGSKRAAVAAGHAILIAVWHMLQRREPFNNMGADYYRTDTAVEARRLIKGLKILGIDVTIANAA